MSPLLVMDPWTVHSVSSQPGSPANLIQMQEVTVSGAPQQSCAYSGYQVWVSIPNIGSYRGLGLVMLQPGLVFSYTPVL